MRIALGIEYNGQDFFGWQRQINLTTVQACVEAALSQIAASDIQVFCAGRTDAGVHAKEQVVHFDTTINRPMRAWTLGTNSYLPSTIAVQWAQVVPDEFHARFSAQSRCYRYFIYNAKMRSAVWGAQSSWFYRPLDEKLMHQAGQDLLGEKDFTSFRATACEAKSPIRTIHHLKVTRQGDLIMVEVQANAFLHHMVRNIVGVLLEIGSGRRPIEWLQQVLSAQDRQAAAVTAPPTGLYLYKVGYPRQYVFPDSVLSGLVL
jgi:tRNA pseudouridine38-40 synthase